MTRAAQNFISTSPRGAARHQRGVALITALLVVALASVAAVSLAASHQLDLRRAQTSQDLGQARLHAASAEALAREVLAGLQMEQDRVREILDETCRTPPLTLERNGAVIRARLEDLHCRINVNNLADPEDEETERALVRLIEQLQGDQEALSIDPERLVSSLRERLGGNGPDDGDGAGRDGGGGRLLASVSELLRLPGVDPEGYRALEPHITALPESGTAINAQLAPPEIRRALNLPAPEDLDPDAFGPGRYARLAISVDMGQRIHRQCAIIDSMTGEVVLRRLRGC